ncbi:MAG: glycoside hydrolase family 2 protein [Bacteroidales bacterium]|nr:glycoside hydrolase family 2 protein [Bacteroidales bacterium]
MRRFLIFFVTALFVMASELSDAQELNIMDLGGNWQFRRAGSKEWLPATVPGVVHLDLMRNKIIPDPYFGDNEGKLQWIGEVGWEYKKTFNYNVKQFEWRNMELVCKGLDTYANVYLNDSLVIVADNMFREWYADIRRFLRIGENTLRIQFPAVVGENKSRYGQLKYKLPGDERVVSRKAAYEYGWDWGPTFITSGIWKPIYIHHWTYVKVLGVNFIQKSITDSMAKIDAQFTIFSQLGDSAQIRLYNDTIEILRQNVILNTGPNLIRGQFTIVNPLLWWPNKIGKPNLYNFKYEVYFGDQLVGEGKQRIGLRRIELVQEKDSIGKSFYFKVNGIPVYMKGANYIPQDNFLPRVKDSTYHALIKDVKNANMNMLRVWGGGIYENDIFYDLCDENGILVWQDFMFACAMNPGTKDFFENVKAEAIQNVVRLRQHPCIALWCGNNEVEEGWKNWGWQKQYGYSAEDSASVYKDYRMLFARILPVTIRRFDSLRPYIPSSPLHGWGEASSMTEGDSHYWGVWWAKEPFSKYTQKVGRFMSEFGFQGFPSLSTIKKFTLPDDRKLGSTVMKAHQKHPVGYETIDEYLLRDYKQPKNFESYLYVSQLVQANGIGSAIQAQRRAKPFCMGSLYWQLNDCWPVVSWSARDYYGRKKALYFESRHQYDDVIFSPVLENGHIKVYIVSDDIMPQKRAMHIQLQDFSGKILCDELYSVTIPANSSLVYYDTLQSALLANYDTASVVFSASSIGLDEYLNGNLLYFAAPKNLKLSAPEITKKITELPSGDGFFIQITADKLVKNAYLSTDVKGDFSNNYFDILPGKMYKVKFYTSEKNIKNEDFVKIISLIDSY